MNYQNINSSQHKVMSEKISVHFKHKKNNNITSQRMFSLEIHFHGKKKSFYFDNSRNAH